MRAKYVKQSAQVKCSVVWCKCVNQIITAVCLIGTGGALHKDKKITHSLLPDCMKAQR
jgi:hypothetical protein